MTILDDADVLVSQIKAEYASGGYEPDGVGLALGTQVSNDPTVLGWGTDLSCTTDCDEGMTEVDPFSPQAVGEALARRLSTSHGRLLADPELLTAVGEDSDYGYDLSRLLHVPLDSIEAQAHQDLAAAECTKDDRVKSADVDVTLAEPYTLTVLITGVLVTGQTFSYTFPLTTSTAETLP